MEKPFVSIRRKLTFSNAFLILGIVIISAISAVTINTLSGLYKKTTVFYRQKEEIHSINTLLYKSVFDMRNIVFAGQEELIPSLLARNEDILFLYTTFEDVSRKLGLLDNISLAEEVEPFISAMRKDFYNCSVLTRQGKIDEAKSLFNQMLSSKFKHISPIIERIIFQAEVHVERNNALIKALILKTVLINTAILLAMLVLSIFINLKVSRSITIPVRKLTDITREIIKTQDLETKIEVESDDEIGQLAESFVKMTKRLRETELGLIQSVKMASLGNLAGGVAHEINNPLTGILNNVQLIRMMAEQKQDFNINDFKELMAVVEESAVRCKRISQALLDFSRADNGMIQAVSLNDIVKKITILIEQECKLNNISIREELQGDIPQISGSYQLLQQALFDIVTNAKWAIERKSGKDGGTIVIKTQYFPEKKNICLSVSDSGIGITKDNLRKIFEPFFTTKDVGEGTGLGLAIVYGIIKRHKGTIRVETEEGKGAIFKINLPVA